MTKDRELTHERLVEVLKYNKSTGVFTWRTGGPGKRNRYAGTKMPNGNKSIHIDGCAYYESILAWYYVTGAWPENSVGHKNHRPGDNRFKNLVDKPHGEILLSRRMRSDNISGHTGVYFVKALGKWKCTISVNKKQKYLGVFEEDDLESAIACREAAEVKYGYNTIAEEDQTDKAEKNV